MTYSTTHGAAQRTPDKSAPTPLTVAESSQYEATSSSRQVEEFVDQCAAQGRHVQKFVFGKTVEGREMVGAFVSSEYYELGDQDGRNVVLLLGNIHSGECDGKEALLMLLRELSLRVEHPWLEQNVIVFVPNYNADANDRMGLLNRPGQLGPIKGMGRRENAQELDLNRDFGKLESPEGRALVALIDQLNPHIFVDCHTTNGSQHRYPLTYDISHNPTTPATIRDFMRGTMLPSITKKLRQQNLETFYYGNFNPEHSEWVTFGHEPRYSTEYVGLRGRLAILSESYSYISYQARVAATKDFVSAILDYATENQSLIHDMLQSIEAEFLTMAAAQPERFEISLAAKPTAFPEKFTVLGFKDDRPHDYRCDFIGNYVATKSTTMPYAYIIPKEFPRVVDRLRMHGIKVSLLSDTRATDVEIDTITDLVRQPIAFQRHELVRAEATRELINRELRFGDYLVRMDQPLGRLASYLLECESDDGFVCWNFFDTSLKQGSEYPVWRVPDPLNLQHEEIEALERFESISLDAIDGPQTLLPIKETPPSWFGTTNLIKTNIYGEETLLDARTASFVERPARPYDVDALTAALVTKGVKPELARELSLLDPQVTVNGQQVIIANSTHSFLHWTAEEAKSNSVLELGCPASERSDDAKSVRDNRNSSKNDLAGPGELFDFNHDESWLAYVSHAGLHLLELSNRQETVFPAIDRHNLVGKLDWVYQEELYGRGNFKGFWWNPQGKQLAFLSLDESPVIPFTVMDHLPIHGKSEVTNYPKAGDPLPKIRLAVADPTRSAEPTWVDLSRYEKDEFLISRVTWSSNGDVLLIQIQNREQTWIDLLATDRDGSNPRVLFRDQTPAWIESPGDPAFVSETEFLWLSPRDGFNRIYKYDLQGKLLATLTTPDWEVRQLLGIDPTKTYAFFTGSENGIDLDCFRLALKDQTIKKLTAEPGNHQVDFSHDFSLFLDQFSTVDHLPESRVFDQEGELLRKINVGSDDRLDYFNILPPEFLAIQTSDGTQLDGMMIKPPNFDPSIRYPVVFHIYAGPQAPRVRNRFDGANYLWHQMLAQQGYVVFLCDNRAASYRNTKNVWPIHKQMATLELQDLESAVAWLKQQSWVDRDRIGLWGWSYGGYMTLYALTHSTSFKLGIAGAPVTDWKNYDAIYTERYMGLPQNNPEGYAKSSVLTQADRLHGKLLLIHGTIDDNVHLNNSMQFVKALQDAGQQFELMLYPNNRHSVQDKKQAAHLRQLMTDFILKNL